MSGIEYKIKDILNEVFTCEPIWNLWDQGVQKALCADAESGFFVIWIVHIITAGLLFLALIVASFFYEQFFPTHHNELDKDEEEMQSIGQTGLAEDVEHTVRYEGVYTGGSQETVLATAYRVNKSST